MIFDTHAHVLSPDRDVYPYGTLRGGATPPVSPVIFPVEELVGQMDARGIDHACLVQRATPVTGMTTATSSTRRHAFRTGWRRSWFWTRRSRIPRAR